MSIPTEQLERWSHQGAVTTAKATADSIKTALNSYRLWPSGIGYEVYLQGSYRNSTNIRGDSDVDVVAQLNTTFYSNLSEVQRMDLGFTPATYTWQDFRSDVLNRLREYYGSGYISEGNKSLKLIPNTGRLPADIVVCAEYRRYNSLRADDYELGMTFWTMSEGQQVINYPKQHIDNGIAKHGHTGYNYKPTVRMLGFW